MKAKRILSLALAVMLCLGLFTVPAAAADITEVVPCKYNFIGTFSDGLVNVSVRDEDYTWFYGFIDAHGNEVVPLGTYSSVSSFSEGLAAVKQNDKWGFIDNTGKLVIPCQYDYTWPFSEGLAAVELEDKWGFIDKTGKQVIPCQYDNGMVPRFSNGLALMMKDEKWGYINTAGQTVVPFQYDMAEDFSDGLALVTVYPEGVNEGMSFDMDLGYVNTAGQTVVPVGTYDDAESFSDGMAAVCVETAEKDEWGFPICAWGFIDTTGKEVIPTQYDIVDDFVDGLAPVCKDGVWGCIDKTGKKVAWGYDYTTCFSDGLALVKKGSGIGAVDSTGKEVIPCNMPYHEVRGFSEGLAAVKADPNGLAGYVDKTGALVVPLRYDETNDFENGFAKVKKDGKYGLLALNAAPTAYQSTQAVNVDGKSMEFQCYALKDANGNMTNYIKLRDLANILNGTAAQFQVGWDGSVTITAKTAYTPNGTEGNTPFSGDRAYSEATAPTKVNGQVADLAAFVLNDDNGGGYTYYQLRDLGKALGFNVGWSPDKGIYLETDKPYDPNN